MFDTRHDPGREEQTVLARKREKGKAKPSKALQAPEKMRQDKKEAVMRTNQQKLPNRNASVPIRPSQKELKAIFGFPKKDSGDSTSGLQSGGGTPMDIDYNDQNEDNDGGYDGSNGFIGGFSTRKGRDSQGIEFDSNDNDLCDLRPGIRTSTSIPLELSSAQTLDEEEEEDAIGDCGEEPKVTGTLSAESIILDAWKHFEQCYSEAKSVHSEARMVKKAQKEQQKNGGERDLAASCHQFCLRVLNGTASSAVPSTY